MGGRARSSGDSLIEVLGGAGERAVQWFCLGCGASWVVFRSEKILERCLFLSSLCLRYETSVFTEETKWSQGGA